MPPAPAPHSAWHAHAATMRPRVSRVAAASWATSWASQAARPHRQAPRRLAPRRAASSHPTPAARWRSPTARQPHASRAAARRPDPAGGDERRVVAPVSSHHGPVARTRAWRVRRAWRRDLCVCGASCGAVHGVQCSAHGGGAARERARGVRSACLPAIEDADGTDSHCSTGTCTCHQRGEAASWWA